MEEEKKLAENIRKDYMYVLKKQRELHAFEECDNIEEVLFARVKRSLDLSDLMNATRLNFKRTRKILNKYAKEYKKEIDVNVLAQEYPELASVKIDAKELYKCAENPDSLIDTKVSEYIEMRADKKNGLDIDI